MWEWRVFGERVEVPTRELVASNEAREDLYLLLDHERGLKVRSRARCELKLCFARDPAGPEHWEKVFDRRLPLDAPWARELLAHLELAHDPRHVTTPEELQQLLGGARPLLVKKQVVKTPHAPAYAVETSMIEVEGRTLRTVCVEAPTREACLEVGRALGLDRFEPRSYPGFLSSL